MARIDEEKTLHDYHHRGDDGVGIFPPAMVPCLHDTHDYVTSFKVQGRVPRSGC